MRDSYFLILAISVCIAPFIRLPFVAPISWYLMPFFAGILIGKYPREIFDRIQTRELLVSFCILSVTRPIGGDLIFIIDTLLCISGSLLLGRGRIAVWLQASLEKLGYHSMNIFLFHTFIYYYWFKDFIYYTRNPLLIFMILLSVCLVISMGIEYLKKVLHFAQCQQKIMNKLMNL